MKILLAGASGQLGQELYPLLSEFAGVVPVDRAPGLPDTVEMDLTDLEAVRKLLERERPDAIVNAAAYTAVDQAEIAERLPFRLNAGLPDCLGRWCASSDATLLHYSTDYVFDGRAERPYREDDPTGPLGVYGESKLAGEWAIAASGCRHLILRTSWVYSTHGNNFVLTMLKLARQRPELSIVTDQTGCPTWARNLASVSARMLRRMLEPDSGKRPSGVLHYCDANPTTWHDFARLIFEQALALGLLSEIPRLHAIASADFPQRARRPGYSVLDTSVIREEFGVEPASLTASLRSCLEELDA